MTKKTVQDIDGLILDMANAGPQTHLFGVNVKMHLLQPGDKLLSHGPQVSFFNSSIDDGFSVSINRIPGRIKVISGGNTSIVSSSEMNIIVEKVMKYRIPMLNFWMNSSMTVDELREQMDAIDKGEEEIFQDVIFDSVTISSEDHGLGVNLKMHILQPGKKKPPYHPRVKLFRKDMATSGFSISISKEPGRVNLAAGSIEGLISEPELKGLVEKVRKYRLPLLNMWHDPAMSQDELLEQMRDIDAGKAVVETEPADFED